MLTESNECSGWNFFEANNSKITQQNPEGLTLHSNK